MDLLRRTGATEVQVRYSDDETPVVWIAVASLDRADGRYWEADGAMDPETAVLRLCALLVDGGACVHCGRTSAFSSDVEGMPSIEGVDLCWYQWDPELVTFRRSCE